MTCPDLTVESPSDAGSCASQPALLNGRGWFSLLALIAQLACACSGGGESTGGAKPCTEQSECDTSSVCLDGHCLTLCAKDEDCSGVRALCDPQLHLCVSCVNDGDCRPEEYCASGSCKPDVCSAGSLSCDELRKKRRVCRENGSEFDETSCPSETSCVLKNDATSCEKWLCTPGKRSCDEAAQVATVCAADGLTQTATDCAANDQGCVDGACRARACEPDQYVCRNGLTYHCNHSGTADDGGTGCDSQTAFCDPATGRCSPQRCKPLSAFCDGSLAAICAFDGSGAKPGGTDCAARGATCEAGECRKVICEPNQRFCLPDSPERVFLCSSGGTLSIQAESCGPYQHCNSANAECERNRCYAGARGCDGEILSVCNADGSAFVSTEDDCAARGLVCSLADGCVANEVAKVGLHENEYFSSGSDFLFNKYHMSTSRRLLKIEQGRSSLASLELTWRVYEADSVDAEMKLVAESTTTAGEQQQQSSGPLDVLLASGKYYAVGLRASGGFAFERSYSEKSVGLLSFGEWVAAGRSSFSAVSSTLSDAIAAPEPLVQILTTTKE